MKLLKPKLKLIHSGLILVSVPLVCGLISVIGLNSALQKSVQLRKSVERKAIASAAVDKLVGDLIQARSDAVEVQLKLDPRMSMNLQIEEKQALSDMNDLKLLLAKHETYRVLLRDVMPVAERTVELLQRAQQLDHAAIQGPGSDSARTQLRSELNTSIRQLTALSQQQAQLMPIDAAAARQYDLAVQQFLGWIIAANVIAATLLSLYFSQNVVRRLNVLVANSERVANQKELLQPIEGDDEIAHLDKVFRIMAEKLSKARQDREEVEKLKKDFITMISHDLRTPLSAVQGTLTLIADGVYGPISDSGVNRAKVAEQSISRLTNLANELLDIERLEANKLPLDLQPTRLQSVIQHSIESLSGFALYKQIRLDTCDTDLVVMANEDRLIQVIVNLLSNAIKFSADGSEVNISTSKSGEQVEIRVTDRGRGISPAMREVIFDRFRQSEISDSANERGMGLGLAICKAIIAGHNGEIGVDSEEGKGCSFWFSLPAAVAPDAAPVSQGSVLSLNRKVEIQ